MLSFHNAELLLLAFSFFRPILALPLFFTSLYQKDRPDGQKFETSQLPVACALPPVQTSLSWPHDGCDDSCPAAR